MVETAAGKRRVPLLQAFNAFQRTHHGSCRPDFSRREKHQGKCRAVLQDVQHRQKTTPAHGMGKLSQTIQVKFILNLVNCYSLFGTPTTPAEF